MSTIRSCFHVSSEAEISIEVDPRTVTRDSLQDLRELGFNRISFGVQDLDPKVQEAVRRRQSEAMTVETYLLARELGFGGINVDLIYGLPLQTRASFGKTAETLMGLKPDRISLFSYARLPWLKLHQKAIREEDLPSTEEKFQIYVEARERFLQSGYVAIGMDHFARPEDPIAIAYREGRLTRNFQGYSVKKAEDMLGFGMSSIGFIEGAFFQNVKTIEEYQGRIREGRSPIFRGFVLSQEDLLRQWVIQEWMCRMGIQKSEFESLFNVPFDRHFASLQDSIASAKREGLIDEDSDRIWALPLGQLFIRLVASIFDAYFKPSDHFSRVV